MYFMVLYSLVSHVIKIPIILPVINYSVEYNESYFIEMDGDGRHMI